MKLFLPYQQSWINDNSQIKIMEKSRQIGISWASAYALVRKLSAKNNKLDGWVSSRDETQARLFLEDCKAFAQTLNIAAKSYGHDLLNESIKSSSITLQFANKRRIHCISSNPDAQAGKRGSRLLDEFALHPDPQNLYTIAYPGITWGGQLEIISTHRGQDNYFNLLIQEIKHNGNPKNISLHTVTLEDALAQGFLQKLKEKLPSTDPRQFMDEPAYFDFIRSACSDELSFRQEYMCEPTDESSFFLPYNLITDCEYQQNIPWEYPLLQCAKSYNDFYLGVDLGRDHDLTVLWLLENIQGTYFTRQLITLQDTPFAVQEKILYDLLELSNLRRACIDQTGLGRQFVENAISRFGLGRVEGINFTNTTKEFLAYSVRSHLENKTLRIPNEKAVRADLRSIRRETTVSGNLRFAADRGHNGHADRFWALALALHATKHSPYNFHYHALPRQLRPSNSTF